MLPKTAARFIEVNLPHPTDAHVLDKRPLIVLTPARRQSRERGLRVARRPPSATSPVVWDARRAHRRCACCCARDAAGRLGAPEGVASRDGCAARYSGSGPRPRRHRRRRPCAAQVRRSGGRGSTARDRPRAACALCVQRETRESAREDRAVRWFADGSRTEGARSSCSAGDPRARRTARTAACRRGTLDERRAGRLHLPVAALRAAGR